MKIKTHIFSFILYGLALGLASLVPFLMLPILSRVLTVAEFGTLALIEISILFMVPFVSLKIESGVGVEYFRLKHINFKVYVFNALLLALVSFFIVFGLLLLFQDFIKEFIALPSYYVLMLPIFALLRVLGAVLLTIYRSKQQPLNYFYLSVTQTIIDFSLSYFMVVILKEGLDGRLWGIYLAFGVTSVWALIYFYQNGYFSYRSFKYIKTVILFSSPLIPHALASVLIVMSDRYFLSYYFGAETVGLYAVAYQVSAIMLLIGVVINQVWGPQLYKWLKNKRYSRSEKYGALVALLLVFCALIVFLSESMLYSFLVDEKFYDSKPFFVWLLLGFLFQGLYFIVSGYLFFYKKTFLLSKITVSMALINLLLNYLMIKEFSAIGVAYATSLTWFLLFIGVLYIVYCRKNKWIEE